MSELNHTRENCSANDLCLGGASGLFCGNCGAGLEKPKPYTKNLHVLRVSYGNEYMTVKSIRFNQSIRLSKYAPRANEVDSYMEEIIIPELEKRGFNIIAKAEFGTDTDLVITDTFKPFKEV